MEIGDSDHRPLVTYISYDQEKPKRFFKYDSRMAPKEGFQDTVRRGWNGNGQQQLLRQPLSQRLHRCRQHISVWKRSNQVNSAERIQLLCCRLDAAITLASTTNREHTELKEALNQAYLEEEEFWKHKSRVQWLRS